MLGPMPPGLLSLSPEQWQQLLAAQQSPAAAPGMQLVRNDNRPGGTGPDMWSGLDAMAASPATSMSAVYDAATRRPNIMNDTDAWLQKRAIRRLRLNDDANVFGGGKR